MLRKERGVGLGRRLGGGGGVQGVLYALGGWGTCRTKGFYFTRGGGVYNPLGLMGGWVVVLFTGLLTPYTLSLCVPRVGRGQFMIYSHIQKSRFSLYFFH